MILRLTSKSFAGISRKLVAVGTSSDASMLATMRAPLPLITVFAPGVAGAAGVGRGGGALLAPGVAGAAGVGRGGGAGGVCAGRELVGEGWGWG